MSEKIEGKTLPHEDKEKPRVIEVTSEQLEAAGFNPIAIGQKVLELFGYKVETAGFGYNSLEIKVIDKTGEVIYKEFIGQ